MARRAQSEPLFSTLVGLRRGLLIEDGTSIESESTPDCYRDIYPVEYPHS
jgi:hypothetical protein